MLNLISIKAIKARTQLPNSGNDFRGIYVII